MGKMLLRSQRPRFQNLYDRYVVVPVDNATNNIVFVSKAHYIHCLIHELDINNLIGNPTYTLLTVIKDKILDIRISVNGGFF